MTPLCTEGKVGVQSHTHRLYVWSWFISGHCFLNRTCIYTLLLIILHSKCSCRWIIPQITACLCFPAETKFCWAVNWCFIHYIILMSIWWDLVTLIDNILWTTMGLFAYSHLLLPFSNKGGMIFFLRFFLFSFLQWKTSATKISCSV